LKEKDIIQHFITQHQHASVAYGIGDDCAILNVTPGHQLVTTTDTMVEGRHFVKQAPGYAIGYKLMATSLSDIASMGAKPKWATLNITLTEYNHHWLSEFAQGLLECAQKNQVALVGGDTTLGKQLNMSVQITGEIPSGHANLRHDARADDIIYVSGVIGRAAYALKQLKQHDYQHSALNHGQISALYKPPSRVELALALRDFIHACIDVSDGLLHELEILCEQSQLGAELHLEKIPFEKGMEIIPAITAGDDYELLFTASQEHTDEISRIASQYNCLITPIGKIANGTKIVLHMNKQIVPYPETSGYDHFSYGL